jgi:hypothetical protein
MTTSHQKEQAERRAYAGSTTGMTYHSRAITGLELERSGRHAQHATVTGSKPAVAYPRQPEGSPWAGDLVPPEEALGWSVEAQEPTGNYHEIAESLREAASVLAFPSDADEAREDVDATPPRSAAPTDRVNVSPQSVGALLRGRKL